MKVKSLYFGDVTIDEADVYKFQEGLPGFPNDTEFCLLEAEDTSFRFLQSVKNESLCFVSIRIFDFFPAYECDIPEHIVERLEIEASGDVLLVGIVRLQERMDQSTVNLLAPIILNERNRKGQQIILQDDRYSIQTPLVKK